MSKNGNSIPGCLLLTFPFSRHLWYFLFTRDVQVDLDLENIVRLVNNVVWKDHYHSFFDWKRGYYSLSGW